MSCYASLALAMSHRAVNATASLMAISDSILRLISTPASFRPCMKVELITPIAIEKGLRFAIREGGRTVGSGVVIEIED